MKIRFYLVMFAVILAAGFMVSATARAQDAAAGFTIEKLGVARGIEDREPVGVSETFSADTPIVYCFLEARNIDADTQVTFAWIHNGKEIHSITLPIKAGPRWRTRAEKTLYGLVGNWKVEIRDSEGNVLKDTSFTVE